MANSFYGYCYYFCILVVLLELDRFVVLIWHNLMNYKNIITVESNKRGGKLCIRRMRITVYDVLEYLASGMTQKEILDDFPYLTLDDIVACLAFAADREKSLSSFNREIAF